MLRCHVVASVLVAACILASVQPVRAQYEEVGIRSADGFELSARYHAGTEGGAGVMLLHQCDRGDAATGLEDLARRLADHGMHVLELDFRGFGGSRSEAYPRFADHMREIAPLMPSDVRAAYDYFIRRPGMDGDAIGLVGASCGASQAIYLASAQDGIRSLVFLSGSLWPGAREAFNDLVRTPVLVATSEDDRVTPAMIELFAASEAVNSRFVMYKGELHGAPLLERDPDLAPSIVEWLADTLDRPAVATARAAGADRDGDAGYYDFWPGTWYRVVNGVTDTTQTRFRVSRSVHPAAYEETWRLVIDSTTTLQARALRAWDPNGRSWRYVWISDAGALQIWEGRKVGADWYIYNEFDIGGERVLSRQAWLPRGPDRLVRVSEHSRDGGQTWQLRFREEYARVAD